MSPYNICGVLVMARPEKCALVEQAMNRLEGVAVHAAGEDGRMVVTVEGPLGRGCADTITGLNDIEGVLSTSLIYHEIEQEQQLEESAK